MLKKLDLEIRAIYSFIAVLVIAVATGRDFGWLTASLWPTMIVGSLVLQFLLHMVLQHVLTTAISRHWFLENCSGVLGIFFAILITMLIVQNTMFANIEVIPKSQALLAFGALCVGFIAVKCTRRAFKIYSIG